MEDVIQIKCPFDGAVLTVRNQPGIESKNVTCPICRNKYPFTQFRRVTPGTEGGEAPTQYPGTGAGEEERTRYATGPLNQEKTSVASMNLTIGKLTVSGSGTTFRLKATRNVIGRRSPRSEADFQIDTGESRAMSREHLVIEVRNIPGRGFVHYLSLFKEKVNDTFIGKQKLEFGDTVVLNHGDIIRLPDATLRFEIDDPESTKTPSHKKC